MTKPTGLQRAIRIFAVLDVLLLVAFLIVHITDFRTADRDGANMDTHDIIPVVTDARASEDALLQPGEAETILRGAVDSSGRAAQSQLSAGETQFDADLVVGSFQQRGGPDFSLYVDTAAFRLIENEGHCYVAASGNSGVNLYLDLSFLPNADAASVAQTIMDAYGTVTSNPAEKTEAFGGHSALHITGSSAENDYEAYVIPINSGCVIAVSCLPGSGAENADHLIACFESLLIY